MKKGKKFNKNGPFTIERFDRYYVMTLGKKTTYTMQMKKSSKVTAISKKVWDKVIATLGEETDLLFRCGKAFYDDYMKRTYPGWYPEWEKDARVVERYTR